MPCPRAEKPKANANRKKLAQPTEIFRIFAGFLRKSKTINNERVRKYD
jgi:hypothetical protein